MFSYVKLFELMYRIYLVDTEGERGESTAQALGLKDVLDGPASLISQSQKYEIRMMNFLAALLLCDR